MLPVSVNRKVSECGGAIALAVFQTFSEWQSAERFPSEIGLQSLILSVSDNFRLHEGVSLQQSLLI